jgi:hypothetical protein
MSVAVRVAAAALVGAALLGTAAGRTAAQLAPPPGAGLQVLLTTTELVVGDNRLAFALLKDGELLAGGRAVVRLHDIRQPEAQLVAEIPVVYQPLEVVEGGRHLHIHPDGTRHTHDAATDVQGIHVAHVAFPFPGPWGIEVLATPEDGPAAAARLRVNVLASGRAPMPGTPAPRSRNLVAADVADLTRIDSSVPPDPRLHQVRIADAIAEGRPQVIVFATPRYCASRVCGPVVDVVRTLVPAYGERVAFIHQEVYAGGSTALAPTFQEWNLPSEPWIFVVDGRGVVRARFEGVTGPREVETALRNVLPAQ